MARQENHQVVPSANMTKHDHLRSTAAPVLLIAFNRPQKTTRVLESIRKARPSRLYVAIDGPRSVVTEDFDRVAEVVSATDIIDWPCEVKRLIRPKNIGCKRGVSSAISWFFENEPEGIILEDDCCPSDAFFPFCEEMLLRYRHKKEIGTIAGSNFQRGRKRGNASYFFTTYPHLWGWASWRRAWQHYDVAIPFWPDWKNSKEFRRKFPDNDERAFWEKLFDDSHAGNNDTWDYQWVATLVKNGSLTVMPQSNLVSNIGFDVDATHTKKWNSSLAIPTEPLSFPLIHPAKIEADNRADRFIFKNLFPQKTATTRALEFFRGLVEGWGLGRARQPRLKE
jgi:hypothetical protein